MSTQALAGKLAKYRSIGGLIESRARELPNKIALKFKDQTYSYAELNSLANRAANGLEQLGVQRGNKVAIMMKNSPEWLAVWFGCAKLGALICPVNGAYKGDELAYQLRHSESTLLITDDGYLEKLEPIKQELGVLESVVVRKTGVPFQPHDKMVDLSHLLEASADAPPPIELGPRDPAAILYTSGTTGPPKGCILPHGQYLVAAEQMRWNCEYNEDSVVYTCLPLFHINAQNYTVLCTIAAGGTVVIDDRFTALASALRVTGGSDNPQDIINAFQDLKYNSILRPTWIRAKENGVYAGISFSHVVPDSSAKNGYKVIKSVDIRGIDYQWPVEDVKNWRKTREKWFKTHKH